MTAVKAKPAVCVHRWQLQEPTPAARGTCSLCGQTKEFSGGTPGDAAWHTTPGSGFNGGKKLKGELI